MVGARGQKVAQVRDGRYSRALRPVGSGGDVSAWLWIGSDGGGWGVQDHGGSLWGETRISEGLNLEVSAPVTPTALPLRSGRGQAKAKETVWLPSPHRTEGTVGR